ncbi:unnamed protein product [Rhizophagus irregularis]|nr:unnamed protein product [Rhizophagus irregularis]
MTIFYQKIGQVKNLISAGIKFCFRTYLIYNFTANTSQTHNPLQAVATITAANTIRYKRSFVSSFLILR